MRDAEPGIRVLMVVVGKARGTADELRTGSTDAVVIDEAPAALLVGHRRAGVDASCAVYDEHPFDEPDEWGISPPSARRPPRHELDADAGRAVVECLGPLSDRTMREVCAALAIAIAVDCAS